MTEPEPKRGCSLPFRLRCLSAHRAATRRCRAVEGQSRLGRARRTRAAMSRSPARSGRISPAKCARRDRPRSWPKSGKSRPAPHQSTHRQAGLPRYRERKGCSSSPRARQRHLPGYVRGIARFPRQEALRRRSSCRHRPAFFGSSLDPIRPQMVALLDDTNDMTSAPRT